MKILRVISSVNPENGGPINGLVNSSRELLKLGHSIDVACLDSPSAPWVDSFEFNIHCFSGQLGTLKYSKKLDFWLERFICNYDVVIIHGLWQYHSYKTAAFCKKKNIPYVVFTHGMLDPWFNESQLLKKIKKNIYWKLFEKNTINNASTVLFTSEEEKLLARRSFKPYFPSETVVSYGSPLPVFEKKVCENKFLTMFPALVGKRVMLFLSRINEKKGIDILVDSLTRVDNFPENFVLAIAGPDSNGLKKKLVQHISKLGLSNKIVWLGMLKDEVKWGAYYSSDAFILPSHQENFGIVVAEALSTSTPVLITNKVNIWREIQSSGAGIVGDDNIDGITSILSKWFGMDAIEKSQMSQAALDCYKVNFSIDSAARDLDKVLSSFIVN
ncbi:glycosyltransferase [Leucothrix sargassi]|nr:glycosyltransferase [Leucothrix sargassi]